MDQLVGSVMMNATELRNAEWWSWGKITTVALITMTTLVILGKLLTSSWQKKLSLPPGPKALPHHRQHAPVGEAAPPKLIWVCQDGWPHYPHPHRAEPLGDRLFR